jgi:hypothetical protein
MKLLVMQFSSVSRHFISLRSKYSPQHPLLDFNFVGIFSKSRDSLAGIATDYELDG